MNRESMTYGQKAAGCDFNPSGDPLVQEAKDLSAKLIDLAYAIRESESGRSERARHASVAITELETAQMRLVKAITFKN